MPSAKIRQWVVSAVEGLWAVTAGVAIMCPALATAQEETKTEELSRKAKTGGPRLSGYCSAHEHHGRG